MADQGNPKAQLILGALYLPGLDGIPQDYVEAMKWFRMSAEHGNASAQYNIGMMYELGEGVPLNLPESVKRYRKAAEQGDADAQNRLGFMYFGGEGIPQDYSEAAKWLRKAADQGNTLAQGLLGAMYHDGTGVPQDYVQAHKWYNLSAARAPTKKGRESAIEGRNLVSAKMTPEQIAEAQKLAREWKPVSSAPAVK